MTEANDEIWAPAKGLPFGYEASTQGRIRKGDKIYSTNGKRYVKISIRQGNGSYSCKSVHRIIAQTFIPNLLNKPSINHKNGIKNDNRVENLEWVNESENRKHALANGLSPKPQAALGKYGSAHNQSKKVVQKTLDGKLVKVHGAIKEAAAELGIKVQGISLCCRGNRASCEGFLWEYYK